MPLTCVNKKALALRSSLKASARPSPLLASSSSSNTGVLALMPSFSRLDDDGRGVTYFPPLGLHVDALDRRRDRLRTGLVAAREAERQVPEEAGPDLLGLSERAGGRRGRAAVQRAPDAQAARESRRLGRRARQWRASTRIICTCRRLHSIRPISSCVRPLSPFHPLLPGEGFAVFVVSPIVIVVCLYRCLQLWRRARRPYGTQDT